jgi:hypothetical protein
VWTIDNFNSTTNVNMATSMQAGGIDTWTGMIPGQVAGKTVRFYFDALKWDNTHDFNPGNNINYTYVTQ